MRKLSSTPETKGVNTRKLVAITISATYPPRRGNQMRTASLLGSLGPEWDVDSFSLTIQRTDLPVPRHVVPVSSHWIDHRTRDPFATTFMFALALMGKPPVFIERVLWAWPHGRLRQ